MSHHPYTLGGDVSHWQGHWEPRVAAEQGWEFAYLRSGSINSVTGVPYTDNRFPSNVERAPEHLRVGVYWYYRPDWPAARQAEHLAMLVGDLVDEPWFLGIDIDLETSGGLIPELVAKRLADFHTLIDDFTGVRADIYTRASFWNVALAGWADMFSSLDFCVARYRPIDDHDVPDLTGPWADGRFRVADVDEWQRWQYSADGNGRGARYGAESNAIDLQYRRLPLDPEPGPEPLPGDVGERLLDLEAQGEDHAARLLEIETWAGGFGGE